MLGNICLLLFIYINNFTADLECNVKLFPEDTLFTVVHDPNAASEKSTMIFLY